MPARPRAARLRLLVATAVAGVVGAHALAYLLAFPDAGARASELSSTGHGYWRLAVGAALCAAVLVAVHVLRRGAVRGCRRGGDQWSGMAPVPSPAWLAAAQMGLFSAVEVCERLTSGAAVGGLVHSPAWRVGLAVQVAVAVAAVLACRLLEAAAFHVSRRRCAARPGRAVLPAMRRPAAPPRFSKVSPTGSRGPPVTAKA